MPISAKKPDWLQAELRIDRERFPYTVFLGEKHVATLYTSFIVDQIRDSLSYVKELNRLKNEKNRLIEIIEREGLSVPEEIEKEDLRSTQVKEDPLETLELYGVAEGQIWQSRRGKNQKYRVTKVNSVQQSVHIVWLGEYDWEADVTFNQLRKYDLVSGPGYGATPKAIPGTEDDLDADIMVSSDGLLPAEG